MQNMASYGRNGDTAMAHLTPGETVVPQAVLQQNPQVARGLGRAFQDVGADPSRYVVGSGQNSMNPMTGQPEFFLDKLIPFLTKAASNPMVQGAFGNAALRKLQGKDVGLRDLLLGGVGGATIGGFTGRGTGMSGLDSLLGLNLDSDERFNTSCQHCNYWSGGTGSIDAAKNFVGKIPSQTSPASQVARAEGLLGIGEFFGTDPNSTIGRMLNNKFGEALTMGLGTQLIDTLFSKDEDPDPGGNLARFNRGSGNAPVTFRPRERNRESEMLYANEGGPAYFPRRNGGIMPSEGSGTEDDVPAMLTAGEFVMTRDAVKGAGNGDLNQGINKMYGMMDSLERTA